MTPLSERARRELRAFAERRLSPEEFEAYVRAPITDSERAATLEIPVAAARSPVVCAASVGRRRGPAAPHDRTTN